MNFIRKQDFMSSRSGLLRGACMPSPDPENASTLGFFTVWGANLPLVSILLFFIALLPGKAWAESYTGESGVVLTYSVSGNEVTITGMATAPSDGKLVIPEQIDGKKVTTVGDGAFLNNYDLQGVTIPKSVTSIANNAFFFCLNLFTITMLPEVPLLDTGWLSGIFRLQTIIVPAGTGETYKSATGWSDYASKIKEAVPTAIRNTQAATSATHAAIYTLDGKKVSKDGCTAGLAKGIYIQNGKKVIIGK